MAVIDITLLKGDPGEPGTPGTNGTNGTNGTDGVDGLTWLTGTSVPGVGIGVDGDLYFRITTKDVYQKSGGAWSWICSLSGNSLSINQTGHGFAVGKPLYYTGATYALAQADTAAHSEIVGCVASVTDADNFVIGFPGYILTLSSLTPGQMYFLDPDSAGGVVTTIDETTDISKPVYLAISSTLAIIQAMRGFEVQPGPVFSGFATITVSQTTPDNPQTNDLWVKLPAT